LEDVFDLQDQVATSVAGVIEPTLEVAETARSTARPTADLTAYDLYMRAVALFGSTRLADALRLVEQAVARDPNYAAALALAGGCYMRRLFDSVSEDRATDRQKGWDLAKRALDNADDDPVILARAGAALAYFGEDIGAMIAVLDRALALNPNYAQGWFLAGMLRMWAGQPDSAIEYVETSLRLSPRTRIGAQTHLIGAAHLVSRRFEQALQKLLLGANEEPNQPNSRRFLAACYAHMGRLDDARAVIQYLKTITLDVFPDAGYLRNIEQREVLLSGLRLAMSEAE
jgi:tetratricopeptide (TPR) repeat protein